MIFAGEVHVNSNAWDLFHGLCEQALGAAVCALRDVEREVYLQRVQHFSLRSEEAQLQD